MYYMIYAFINCKLSDENKVECLKKDFITPDLYTKLSARLNRSPCTVLSCKTAIFKV